MNGAHAVSRSLDVRTLSGCFEDAEAERIQIIMVHTLDRWSRNVMVTLQSFRILADHHIAFISLSEHIDYSAPEGRLQLTILAAFAAYFSDMLARHTSKGKGERAAQGLHNGDIPFGYRWVGAKLPLEYDPKTFPGLRLIGELRMQGMSAERIATAVNAAGYRTGSKRFGERLFTIDTINAITRNAFSVALAVAGTHPPGDAPGRFPDQPGFGIKSTGTRTADAQEGTPPQALLRWLSCRE